jgi:hypothetical protein
LWVPATIAVVPAECCCLLKFIMLVPGIGGIPGVASDSEVPFKLAVTGGSHVIGFPAADGVLAVTCIPAHPGVPILAGGYTSDLLQDY